MSEPDPNLEELVRGICWKLYLEKDSPKFNKNWQEFTNSSNYQEQARKICDYLADIAKRMFACRLGVDLEITNQDQEIEKLWSSFIQRTVGIQGSVSPEDVEKWRKIVNRELKESIRSAITQVLSQKRLDLPRFAQEHRKTEDRVPASALDKQVQKVSSVKEDTSVNRDVQNIYFDQGTVYTSEPTTPGQVKEEEPLLGTQPSIRATDNLNKGQRQEGMSTSLGSQLSWSSEQKDTTLNSESESAPVKPPWKYLPVPDDEPDKHEEFDCKTDQSREGLKLIGARVRGKMHKHNGTNCDDWFEFAVIGDWTIIAVADGAGSKKFSRIGAKVSCKQAVEELKKSLKGHHLSAKQTEEDLSNSLKRCDNWDFVDGDINFVQTALHQAMNTAYEAVEAEVNRCREFTRYYKALGNRDLDIKDLSATLLLAVHTTVKVGETNYNLVLTCQVGDGMLAAISQESKLELLGKPDSGEHSGQTEFLSSKKVLDKNNLLQKTSIFVGSLKALMVMSDGVADDYFPPNPGMLELYGDLVLNQIVNTSQPDETEINQQLQNTNLGSRGGVEEAKHIFQEEVERIVADESNEPKTVLINSVGQYARELGKYIPEVVTSNALLAAARKHMCHACEEKKPEAKLQLWLDSYYRRGSFDDRTLVVLYREEV